MDLYGLANTISKSVSTDVSSFVYEKLPVVEYYVTQGGKHMVFINPFWIWEFPTSKQAATVSYWRFAVADSFRIMHVLLFLRFNLPFFGITPMDEGWVQATYEFTSLYVNRFVGIMPTVGGVDLGLLFAFYLLDKLDSLVTSIIILDAFGNRF